MSLTSFPNTRKRGGRADVRRNKYQAEVRICGNCRRWQAEGFR
jgi:hypothetical protein